MMKRAYSLLQVKAFDEDKRELTGIATTPSTDSYGDVVEPKGAEFDLPIPFLWQHNSSQPIGHVTKATVKNDGIEVTVKLVKTDEPGTLKNRLDEAWQSIKLGLVRGLSIGFRSIEHTFIEGTHGIHFIKWMWLELSAVTIPANSDASITAIKSIDREIRGVASPSDKAAPGQTHKTVKLNKSAGASAKKVTLKPKEADVNIQDQIKEWTSKRAATVAAIANLVEKAVETGETLDAEQREKHDELKSEVKAIDDHLEVLKGLESLQAAQAKPVETVQKQTGPTVIVKNHKDKEEDFQGQNFVRRVIARTASYLSQGEFSPGQIAEQRWGKTNPQLVQVIKAGVAGGASNISDAWGSELVQADGRYTGDFIEYLSQMTVFDKLPLRDVPAHVTIKGQDGVATGYWVGESKAIPVSAQDFTDVTLTPSKVGAISVISKELIMHSSPSAEQLVRDGLVTAAAQRIDATFLGTSPASGATPAGMLNGVIGLVSAGTDGDSVRQDIRALIAKFQEVYNASGLYWVMNTNLETGVALMKNALGVAEFPEMASGNLFRYPFVTGDNVGANHLILLKPSDIYKIGDGGIQVSVSDQATIEQDSAPAGDAENPTAASATLSSMFQTENVALKVVRTMNFAKRRASAVQYIEDADYNAVTSS